MTARDVISSIRGATLIHRKICALMEKKSPVLYADVTSQHTCFCQAFRAPSTVHPAEEASPVFIISGSLWKQFCHPSVSTVSSEILY
jgi:hypothetical protein